MTALTVEQAVQILTDPENQPHQFVGDPEWLKKELGDLTALREQLAEAQTYKAWPEVREPSKEMLALCSLTPGGSEYANDPAACVAYARKVRESQHEAIIKFKTEANELRARLTEVSHQLVMERLAIMAELDPAQPTEQSLPERVRELSARLAEAQRELDEWKEVSDHWQALAKEREQRADLAEARLAALREGVRVPRASEKIDYLGNCVECGHGNRLNGEIVHAYGCSYGNNAAEVD